jgi:hypothetical protein
MEFEKFVVSYATQPLNQYGIGSKGHPREQGRSISHCIKWEYTI